MATATGAVPAMKTHSSQPRKVNTNCGNCDYCITEYIPQCDKTGRYVPSHYRNSTKPGWCPLKKEQKNGL
jgi:hypothetical protein